MTDLPAYFMPLAQSLKVNGEVTKTAIMDSYELFIESVTRRDGIYAGKPKYNKSLTNQEHELLEELSASQVVLPNQLDYDSTAAQTVAEIYFKKVMSLWSSVKRRQLTPGMDDLITKKIPVRFTAPKIEGQNAPKNLGLLLRNFNHFKLRQDNSILRKATIRESRRQGQRVEMGDAWRWVYHQTEADKYIVINQVFSASFWFKTARAFTISLIAVLLLPFVFIGFTQGVWTALTIFGISVFFTFLGGMLIFMLGMIGFLIFDEDLIDVLSDITYVKTTKLGKELSEELIPWDKYVLNTPEASEYSEREKPKQTRNTRDSRYYDILSIFRG